MDTAKFRTVAQFSDPIRAHIVAAMLNDNGVAAAVFGEVSPYPSLSYAKGIEVKVNEGDYDTVMSLLAASDKAE